MQRKLFGYLTLVDDFDEQIESIGTKAKSGSLHGIWRRSGCNIPLINHG